MAGRAVFFGASGATTAVGALVAVADPSALVAVTTTRIRQPTSAPASLYVAAVTPVSAQAPPAASQRSQRTTWVSGAAPVQMPLPAASVWPSTTVPLTAGAAVATGGCAGPTTEVAPVTLVAAPAALAPVTATRSV